MWMKYRCAKMGIGPAEFNRSRPKDIIEILEIGNTINAKIEHEREVAEKINQMQGKW